MIFNFLRKYLKDEEFDQTKQELAETRQVLKEYREFLVRFQNENRSDDREKVEPDFLMLVWASVGIAIAIFISSGQKAVELQEHMDKLPVYIWIILAIFSLYFIVANGLNAIILTRKYVESKESPVYKNFEWYITAGTILLVLATLALAFLA